MTKVKLKIDGMHCTACAMNIDFDLEDLNGIKSTKTNYAKQESEIEFDEEKVTLQQVLKQIVETGYNASVKENKNE